MGDSKQERKKSNDDELYELEWNFKLMLRTAFPDGIAIHQIESQYEEFVGKKLEFDTFKSKKYNTWAALFSKCRVLRETFYLRKQSGEQLVKIQQSNISYTKKEIQRVIQLGCYGEHKRKLNLEELEEKPKPVIEEQKPRFIDGSTQVEITKTETNEKEVQTDTAAEIPHQKQHPPPPRQVALTYHSPPSAPAPAPTRNLPRTLIPTSIAAANGHGAKQPGGSSQIVLEPLGKQNVGIQTSLPDSVVRRELEISGIAVDKASPTQTNGPMLQSASTSCKISGKRPYQQSLLVPSNCHILDPILETKIDAVSSTSGIPVDVRLTVVKRSTPTDDMQSTGNQGTPQKKLKSQEEVGDVYASHAKVTARCLFPAYDARSAQTECNNTSIHHTPSPSTGGSSESSTLQYDPTSSSKSTDSNELDGILQPNFLEELDEQVQADLKQLSALSSSPREEISGNTNSNINRLVPPPAPKLSLSSSSPSSVLLVNLSLNEIVLKKFEPQLTRVYPAFLYDCIGMLKGATLFDQPLTDLMDDAVGSSSMGRSTKGWCAYLVQDNTPTVGRQLRGFYLGDENKTYFLTERGWILDTHLQLPPFTLVYGEFVIRRDKQHGRYNQIFEIIDVGYLNGNNLSQLDIVRRRRQCKAFFKTYRPSFVLVQVKVKDFLFLNQVEHALKRMCIREKEAANDDGLHYTTVTGVQIVRSNSGGGNRCASVFGFGESIRNRYLITWPPILDTCNFPGNGVMDPLHFTFNL